jgi:hypothetical protein
MHKAMSDIGFKCFRFWKTQEREFMSFNAFTMPALPQPPPAGLNDTLNGGSTALESCRYNQSADKGQSFLSTLNQINDHQYDHSRDTACAENTAGVSDDTDNQSVTSGKMGTPGDNPHDDMGDTGGAGSAQAAPCIHPSHALRRIHQHLFNFLMSDESSLSDAIDPDSTAGSRPSWLADLIAFLEPEGQPVPNGQVGIGLFEQLQTNISPELNNLYFLQQLAAGVFNHQDNVALMRFNTQFWGFGDWMAMSANDLNDQTRAFGAHANPAIIHLLHMQGLDSSVLGFPAEADGAGGQTPAANLTTIDLNGEFLFKMSAYSQQGGSDISENNPAAVMGSAKDGRLFPLATDSQNMENAAETKFQLENKNSLIDQAQAANPKSASEVAMAKPAEDAFNLKGSALNTQMPLSAEVVDKVVQIEGENKDSSLLQGQDQMSQRLAKFENATQTSESAQRSLSSQAAMNQIVQKAVLLLNNGQNEVRIHLKPEFLGQIQMQIVTDSHQVAIKILAENPFVKDMLESNLNQLKADLQAQHLNVGELEVSVAHDSHSGAKNQTAGEALKSSASRSDAAGDDERSEEPDQAQADGSETMAENAIDYFA